MKLLHGDCYELIRGIVEDTSNKYIIVTDPPFNIGYHYNWYKDNLDEGQYFEWLGDIVSLAPCVVIHYPEALYKLSYQIGVFPERVVSWVYNSNTARQHRDIAFFRINPDFSKVQQPYKNLNDKRIKQRIAEGKTGAKIYDWWNINQVKNVNSEKTEHPCQMPVEIMENIIGLLPDDCVVIDPFMGSGTTGIACINLNRDFIGIEKDDKYFEIAEKRINGFIKDKKIQLF